ncbi:MAG: L,D-transpeptidase [Pseudomonadota bacterium]
MDRRHFLQGVAGFAAIGVAGCNPLLPEGADPSLLTSAYAPSPNEKHRIRKASLNVVPRQFHRRVVRYNSNEKPGTIVVDTNERYLYLVDENNVAIRYGIGVGREGFEWAGRATVRRKAKWPRWTPPPEMIAREPRLKPYRGGMPGGIGNPLGARALYLFQGNRDTLYRLHGTNDPKSIGKAMSSGCVRLLNHDVADLYERTKIGTRVVVT